MLFALGGFGYALVQSGGRDRGATAVASALAMPALVACRPWRRVPLHELALGLGVMGAAVLIPFITPLGVSEAKDLDVFVYGPILYVVVRAFAIDGERRRLTGVALLAAAAYEWLKIWPVWTGENDRSYRIVGTFYWHNQLGIYAAATALLAVTYVVRGGRAERLFGAIVGPAAAALCVLSHSRGAELSLAVAGAGLALTLVRRFRLPAVGGLLGVTAATAAVVALMLVAVSPHHGATDTVTALGSTSVGSSSSYRTQFIEAAAKVFAHNPLVSHGYGSFAHLSGQYLPGGAEETTWVHSAPLQALTDGGLVLGLPVIATLAALLARWLRVGLNAIRPSTELDATRLGAAAAGVALLIHTCIDFDSQYPVLVALLGACGALAAPETTSRNSRRYALTIPAIAATVAAAIAGLLLVNSYWTTTAKLAHIDTLASQGDASAALAQDAKLMNGLAPDPRPGAFTVREAAAGNRVSAALLSRALDETRGYKAVDSTFRATWQEEHQSLADQPSR